MLVSLACLVAQQALTVYPGDGSGQQVFWLAVGCLLLWLVYRRRSRVARVVIVFTAMFGAVLFATQWGAGSTPLILSLLYLGQALPLMSRTVRDHVAPQLTTRTAATG